MSGSDERLPASLRACVEAGYLDQDLAEALLAAHAAGHVCSTKDQALRPGDGQAFYSPLLLRDDEEREDPGLQTLLRRSGDQLLMAVCSAIVGGELAAAEYGPLTVLGTRGLGKTSLLRALVASARAANTRAIYISAIDLEAEIERAFHLGQRAELRRWLLRYELVAIDDLQRLAGHHDLETEILALAEATGRGKLWLALGSTDSPVELEHLDTDLYGALNGGLTLPMPRRNRKARAELLQSFVGERSLPEAVLTHLRDTGIQDAQLLRGTIAELKARQQLGEDEVTVELTQQLLGLSPDPKAPPPTPSDAASTAPPPSTVEDGEPSAGGATEIAGSSPAFVAEEFKDMLASAESAEEQALAVEIALMERLRMLREEGAEVAELTSIEEALTLLRQGRLFDALEVIG